MKEISLSSTISGCSAQYYFEVLYKDERAMQRYHEVVNDDRAVVSQWEHGARFVEFNMPVKVSGTLKQLIGVSSVHVKEQQIVEWTSPQEFQLKSIPEMGFPGSSKFTTSIVTKVAEQSPNTLLVTTIVICSASLPWPLHSQVESIMAEQAKDSISEFLNFCSDWVADALRAAPVVLELDLDETQATASAVSTTIEEDLGLDLQATATSTARHDGDGAAAVDENEPSSSHQLKQISPAAGGRTIDVDATSTAQQSQDEQFFDVYDGFTAEDLALIREAAHVQIEQLACLRSMEASSIASFRLLEQLIQQRSVLQESSPAPAVTDRIEAKGGIAVRGGSRSLMYSWLLPMTVGAAIGCSVTYIALKKRH